MKRWRVSGAATEMEMKTHRGMAGEEEADRTASVGGRGGELAKPALCWRNGAAAWQDSWASSQKVKPRVTVGPRNPARGFHRREVKA